MRIGLIGVGRWGKNIVKTIMDFEEIELSCVTSSNHNIYDFVPKECSVYRDWGKMLNHHNLDGIIISTPPKTHYEIAKASVLKGIPVLVEKPLTLNSQEAESLIDLAFTNKTNVRVNHIYLYHSLYRILKKHIKNKKDLRFIYSQS